MRVLYKDPTKRPRHATWCATDTVIGAIRPTSMKGKLASGKAKSKIENCCPPAPAPGAREAKAKGRFKWRVTQPLGYARRMR